jgi:hypothetical protein
MITVQNIIDWAGPHRLGDGMKSLRIGNDDLEFSIIGGEHAYGDFVKTFEVAVFNLDTDDYMTTFFFPDSEMVASYVKGNQLVKLINQLNKKNDFQVR